MISSLVSLKNLVKTKSYHIDFPVFRLHYQVTVSALLAFCLILSAKLLFGDTIDCQGQARDDFYDQTCFSLGTSTEYAVQSACLDRALAERNTGSLMLLAPAVNQTLSTQPDQFYSNLKYHLESNFRLMHRLTKSDVSCLSNDIGYIHSGVLASSDTAVKVTYWHNYYRYVPVILFLQAVLFYFPHYLWKLWENGVVSSICKELYENRFAPKEHIESKYHIIDYMHSCFKLNKSLVYKYHFCNLLLMLNLIAQIVILNDIFNGHFITYGVDFLYHRYVDDKIYGLHSIGTTNEDQLNHPMDYLFPKITSCTIDMFNSAGGLPNRLQFLCVLPLNILHDKFFLILWFWLLILAIITALQTTFDLFYILIPPLRRYHFDRKYGSFLSNNDWHRPSLAEHFLLDLIGHNSDKFAFSALLKKLNEDEWNIDGSPSDSASFV